MSQIEAALLQDVLLFLDALPRDLGRGSLNGMSVQLNYKVRAALSQQSPAPSPDYLLRDLRDAFVKLLNGIDIEDLDGIKVAELALAKIDKSLRASPAPSVEPAAWKCRELWGGLPSGPWFLAFDKHNPELYECEPLDAAPTAAVHEPTPDMDFGAFHEPEARDQGHPAQATNEGKA